MSIGDINAKKAASNFSMKGFDDKNLQRLQMSNINKLIK